VASNAESTTTWRTVRSRLTGTLLLPDDDGYDAARKPWNLAVDQRPAAIATPADVDDVQAIIAAAREAGLGVTTQPNGHGAEGSLEDAVLIRPTAFDEITIDVENRSARVGAGVNWGAVLSELDGSGLIALAGSNPTVNAVAYTLGGGHSMFSRAYGLASESLRAVELVDASGEFRRVTDATDPELMWALRGGGGLFGVVTSIEFDLHPGDQLFGGGLIFPIEAAPAVLTTATALARDYPRLGLDAGMGRFPDLDVVPAPVRGRTVATLSIVHIDDEASAAPIIERVRAIAPALVDGLTAFTIGQLAAVAGEPTDPMPYVDAAGAVKGFDEDSAAVVVDAFLRGADLGLGRLGVRFLGGRIAEASDALLGGLRADALIGASALVFSPEALAGADAALRPVTELVEKLHESGMLPTFLGARASLADAFAPDQLARLADVKRRVDPDGVIRSNRPLR
jgi:FAD/FMN-containing dehydrogenase